MTARSEHEVPWDDDFWEVNHAAARLTQYACEVAARCLDDGMLRLQFTQEMAYVGKGIVEEVRTGRKTPEQGLIQIKKEYAELAEQFFQYSKLVAGLAAGVLQVAGGVAVCKLTAGFACATGGIALVQHGINAIYENGQNIFSGRTDTVGPLRKGYQEVAMALGGKASHGNVAYGAADIVLSGFGLTTLVVGRNAWRLFRYIRSDMVPAYKNMGAGLLGFELGVNVMNGELIWVELEK
ncbi:DUF4225 domain-containing protein [Pseudomonas entomophila]|uniref:DUF4225 domain-containing protein n=1 Tax=Pseudomonas entomophila TaxID=312306 RepID=UPI001F0160C9|nr:DUF4225 domain-containing protein [Pseudomonas entomophila]MCG8291780.1 DUF4225 domain-containing protein [Pseudomonas entomophila]